MVNDITAAIKGDANYLAALGLFCYTEIIGRSVLKLKTGQNKPSATKSFNEFLRNYMGYKKLVDKHKWKIYDWFRNGLAHEFPIKRTGVGQSGVFVQYDKRTSRQGIFLSNDNEARFIILKAYFRDFKKGIKKYLADFPAQAEIK